MLIYRCDVCNEDYMRSGKYINHTPEEYISINHYVVTRYNDSRADTLQMCPKCLKEFNETVEKFLQNRRHHE